LPYAFWHPCQRLGRDRDRGSIGIPKRIRSRRAKLEGSARAAYICPARRKPPMPITLPATLPAFDVLAREGVSVMSESRAARQDIRPLKIGLLNLMPKKIQTENQFARLIGATPLQIDFRLIRMSAHRTRNTAAEHMAAFYRPFQKMQAREGSTA
jgi:hypothetical protein